MAYITHSVVKVVHSTIYSISYIIPIMYVFFVYSDTIPRVEFFANKMAKLGRTTRSNLLLLC